MRQSRPHLHPPLSVGAHQDASFGTERESEDGRLVRVDASNQLLLGEIPDAHLVVVTSRCKEGRLWTELANSNSCPRGLEKCCKLRSGSHVPDYG